MQTPASSNNKNIYTQLYTKRITITYIKYKQNIHLYEGIYLITINCANNVMSTL